MSDTASHHSDSSFDEADDQDWADWVDDDEGTGGQTMQYGTDEVESSSASKGFKVPTKALFPGSDGRYSTFDSPVEALEHAKQAQSCDLVAVVKRARELRRRLMVLMPRVLSDHYCIASFR